MPEQCVNGCGDMDVATGHIYTNQGDTYFKVAIYYCPTCKYVSEVDTKF